MVKNWVGCQFEANSSRKFAELITISFCIKSKTFLQRVPIDALIAKRMKVMDLKQDILKHPGLRRKCELLTSIQSQPSPCTELSPAEKFNLMLYRVGIDTHSPCTEVD